MENVEINIAIKSDTTSYTLFHTSDTFSARPFIIEVTVAKKEEVKEAPVPYVVNNAFADSFITVPKDVRKKDAKATLASYPKESECITVTATSFRTFNSAEAKDATKEELVSYHEENKDCIIVVSSFKIFSIEEKVITRRSLIFVLTKPFPRYILHCFS
jgi:hypothetical protein